MHLNNWFARNWYKQIRKEKNSVPSARNSQSNKLQTIRGRWERQQKDRVKEVASWKHYFRDLRFRIFPETYRRRRRPIPRVGPPCFRPRSFFLTPIRIRQNQNLYCHASNLRQQQFPVSCCNYRHMGSEWYKKMFNCIFFWKNDQTYFIYLVHNFVNPNFVKYL